MAERHWLRHSVQLAGAQVRELVQAVRQNPAHYWLGLFGLGCGFVASGMMSGLFAVAFRQMPRPISLSGKARIYLTVLWGFFVVAAYRRATWYNWDRISKSFLLTTVSPRTALTGIILGECTTLTLWLLVPSLCLAGAFVYGFQTPLPLVTILLAEVLLMTTAVIVGYTVGFTVLVRQRNTESTGRSTVGLLIRVVVALVGLAYVLFSQGFGPQVSLPSPHLVFVLPPGWLLDLIALGTPITDSPIRAVGAVISSGLVLVVGGFLIHRLALTYWYGPENEFSLGEPGEAAERDDASEMTTLSQRPNDALSVALSPFWIPRRVRKPVAGIATERLIRLQRNPRRATFFLMPAVTLTVLVAAQSATPWATSAAIGSGTVPWAMGAIFGLNPLGDEGAALPSTLLSLSAGAYVQGLALPAVLVGIPLVIIWVGIASLLAGMTVSTLGGLLLVGGVLTGVAAVLAPAVGMHFPQYNSMRVGSRTAVVIPGWTAIAVYTMILGFFGSLSQLFIPPSGVGVMLSTLSHIPLTLVRLSGLTVSLTVITLLGVGVYTHAVSQVSQTKLG